MTLADFIKDDNRAYAIEIMNANATTVEEMMAVIHKAKSMCTEFYHVVEKWMDISFDYENMVRLIDRRTAELERLMEFKNSKVASLIAKYIGNRTPELLKEIEAEIEATNNPFKITIYEKCIDYDWNDYYFDKFYIDTIQDFYTTKRKFDLDEDIERRKQRIKWDIEEKEKYEKLKEEMLAKYGDCLLDINLYED